MTGGKNRENLFNDEELDRILEEDEIESNIGRSEFNEEELEVSKAHKKNKRSAKRRVRAKNKSKLTRLIVIIVVCLAVIAAGVYFITNLTRNKHQTSYASYNTTLENVGNGKIKVFFYLAELEDDFIEFTEDPDYVYVKLYYSITNATKRNLSWEDMPYVSVCKYDYVDGVYTLVEGSEQEFDIEALRSYALRIGLDFSDIKSDLEPDRIPPRYGADIIKIPKSEWDINKYFVTIDNVNAIIKINDPKTNEHLKLFKNDDATTDDADSSDTDADTSDADDE